MGQSRQRRLSCWLFHLLPGGPIDRRYKIARELNTALDSFDGFVAGSKVVYTRGK